MSVSNGLKILYLNESQLKLLENVSSKAKVTHVIKGLNTFVLEKIMNFSRKELYLGLMENFIKNSPLFVPFFLLPSRASLVEDSSL